MDDPQNSDPNRIPDPMSSSQHPKLDSGRTPFPPTPFGRPPSGRYTPPTGRNSRVQANSGLIRIGQTTPDPSSAFDSSADLAGGSGVLPAMTEDDEGGEAASARIAQEYRRQVRIKRLAEEIQLAEREKKKEEEVRRKTETQMKLSTNIRRKVETAKLDMDQSLPLSPPAESDGSIAKKREVAMSAFKTAAVGKKNSSGLPTAVLVLFFIGLVAGGA